MANSRTERFGTVYLVLYDPCRRDGLDLDDRVCDPIGRLVHPRSEGKEGEEMIFDKFDVKKEPSDLYEVSFCPFCGGGNLSSVHWTKRISFCNDCEAEFQVFETESSDRKDLSDKTAL